MEDRINHSVRPDSGRLEKHLLPAARRSFLRRLLSFVGFAAVNTLPALCVFLYEWDLFDLVLLYWAESVVIGFYTILKMLYVDTASVARDIEVYYAVPVFLGIYTFFCWLIGMGILFFFKQLPELPENDLTPESMVYTAHLLRLTFVGRKWICLFIFVCHGMSFVSDYLRSGQFYRASLGKLMLLPMIRGITLAVMVVGVVSAIKQHSPLTGLMVIVCLKIACDTFFGWLEWNKLAV